MLENQQAHEVVVVTRVGRVLLGGALFAAAAAVAGCSFLGKQVAISAADSCIEKQCQAEQGKARQECLTECQRQYGPR